MELLKSYFITIQLYQLLQILHLFLQYNFIIDTTITL